MFGSKVLGLDDAGLVIRDGRAGEIVFPYPEMLTAERVRASIESGLRFAGVRIVAGGA